MTGRHQALYSQIDRLGSARTVQELVRHLQPILEQLAYAATTGEADIIERHEEWHNEFADRLYQAAETDRQEVAKPPPAAAKIRSSGPTIRRPETGGLTPALRAIMEGTHSSLSGPD